MTTHVYSGSIDRIGTRATSKHNGGGAYKAIEFHLLGDARICFWYNPIAKEGTPDSLHALRNHLARALFELADQENTAVETTLKS